MKHRLEDDHYCFICGENNPSGLHLNFSLQNGKVRTEFTSPKTLQGYKNIIHGGIISALLDEAMVKTALLQGIPAVTVEITVRFKNPLMTGEASVIEAEITDTRKRIIHTSAVIKKSDDTLIAEARAKLLRQN